MAIDEMPTPTISFFRLIYPELRSRPLTQEEMAAITDMTPQAAKKHLRKLCDKGYVLRDHYRQWSLPRRFPVHDPLLLAIAKAI